MIAPKIPKATNGQILTTKLVNHIITRIEYAGLILKGSKCLSDSQEILIAQAQEGTIISSGTSLNAPKITSADSIETYTSFYIDYQIIATNVPLSYNATNLPPGLFINTETGLITGTIATVGTYFINLTATNEFGTGKKRLRINILEIPSGTGGPISLEVGAGGPRATPLITLSWSQTAPAGTTYSVYRNGSLLANVGEAKFYSDSAISNFVFYKYYVVASTNNISNEVYNGCTPPDYFTSGGLPNYRAEWVVSTDFGQDPPTSTQKVFYGFTDGLYFLKLVTGFGPNPSATGTASGIGSLSTTSLATTFVYKSRATFFGVVTVTNNQGPIFGLAGFGNFNF